MLVAVKRWVKHIVAVVTQLLFTFLPHCWSRADRVSWLATMECGGRVTYSMHIVQAACCMSYDTDIVAVYQLLHVGGLMVTTGFHFELLHEWV